MRGHLTGDSSRGPLRMSSSLARRALIAWRNHQVPRATVGVSSAEPDTRGRMCRGSAEEEADAEAEEGLGPAPAASHSIRAVPSWGSARPPGAPPLPASGSGITRLLLSPSSPTCGHCPGEVTAIPGGRVFKVPSAMARSWCNSSDPRYTRLKYLSSLKNK